MRERLDVIEHEPMPRPDGARGDPGAPLGRQLFIDKHLGRTRNVAGQCGRAGSYCASSRQYARRQAKRSQDASLKDPDGSNSPGEVFIVAVDTAIIGKIDVRGHICSLL